MRSLLLILALSVLGVAQSSDTTKHESKFATVNGARLHYLDFGGQGDVLIFLTGMGDTAHIYDEMAPKFADDYRVFAFTRRGFGESERTETGYDAANLTKDLRLMMDHLKVQRAHLIGHSAAGNEITNFAAMYPTRTGSIVYLDAAYDRSEVAQIEDKDPLAVPPKAIDAMTDEEKFSDKFAKHLFDFDPQYRRIKSRALSFYAIFEKHWALKPDTPPDRHVAAEAFIKDLVQPYQNRNIQRFRREVRNGKVVILRDTHHYFFRDARRSDAVISTIREFLRSK